MTDYTAVLAKVPQIGLGYLATIGKNLGYEVTILDCANKGLDADGVMSFLQHNSFDIVGLQCFTFEVGISRRIIKRIKAEYPNIITLLGGPHPTAVKEKIFCDIPELDYSFVGESEIGFSQFLKSLPDLQKDPDLLKSISGLCYLDSFGAFHSTPPEDIDNLDSLPFPDWSQIDPNTYPRMPQGLIFKQSPMAPIIATRGCPFKCTFCSSAGTKIRSRSINNVIEEIKFLQTHYGVREIHFLDDNLSFYKSYIKELSQRIIDENLGISWCCTNGLRIDCLDLETVRLMKRSGCYYISLGIESGSDRVLEFVKKKIGTQKTAEKIKEMGQVSGLDINGYFILGFPTETLEEMNQTIDYALSLPLARANFHTFIPLPGTEVFGHLMDEGWDKEGVWETCFQGEIPYIPKGLTKGNIVSIQRRALRKFYLRPHILWKLFRSLHSLDQIKSLLMRLIAFGKIGSFSQPPINVSDTSRSLTRPPIC